MRISGFASGMDIDSMVKELMQAKRAPLDKLNQQKQLLDWKREAYRAQSTKMVSFLYDKLSNLKNTFSTQGRTASITGDTTAVSVQASNSATSLPVTVEVSQVATAAQVQMTFSGVSRNTVLSEVLGTGVESSTIKINDIEVEFNPTVDTMQNLVQKINNKAGSKATATFDSATGNLTIKSKDVGSTANLRVSGDLFKDVPGGTSSTETEKSVLGGNTEFKINGVDSTVLIANKSIAINASNSNVITYDGLQITLKETGTVTIETKPDTDKLVNAVKSFVEDYNSLIGSINGKLGEERYRSYLPLSDDQKKELNEDDIKLWQEKAQSGMLKNDDILSSVVSGMRTALTSKVSTPEGDISIFSLGISTGKWNEGGKLVIENEDQLKQMIELNPEQVINFFSSVGTSVSDEDKKKGIKYSEDTGILNRLSNLLNDGLNRLAERAGTSRISSDINSTLLASSQLGMESRDLDSRISNMKDRLNRLETSYYKQFTAMESAINRYNAQSGSLSSFLS